MVKKSRKAKNRNSDFQKVKLKVGRKLKKADNVTNTSFKSRGIHIKEQLLSKTDENLPTTKRKQNFTELTTQLHHYNSSIRHDAVLGLQQLLLAHPALIHSHLAQVAEHLSELFVDKDAKVRQAVIDVLKHLLPHISANSLSPFFPLVCAHLCCAMTHIYEDIKVHSLVILDLLLGFYPRLIAQNGGKILPIFIDQILQRNQVQKSGSGFCSLSINPNSKLSSAKWRGKILDRLHRLLMSMVEDMDDKNVKGPASCVYVKHYTDSVSVNGSEAMDTMGSTHTCEFSLSDSDGSGGLLTNRTEKLLKLIETLIPLLLQIWIEVSPNRGSNSAGSAVHEDSVVVLSSIVGIVKLLWKCLLQASEQHNHGDWFREKFLKDFTQCFMSGFPYAVHRHPGKSKSKSSSAGGGQMAVHQLNLSVCEVMSHLVSEAQEAIPECLSAVVSYVVGGSTRNILHGVSATTSVRLLQLENLPADKRESLFDFMYELDQSGNMDINARNLIMEFLVQVSADKHILTQSETFSKWMQGFPSSVIASKEPERSCYVNMLSRLAVCRPAQLIQAVQQNFAQLAGIFPDLSASQQVSLVHVFTCVDNITSDNYKQLTKVCYHSGTDTKTIRVLAQALYHRIEKRRGLRHHKIDYSYFFSFLISIILGSPSNPSACVTPAEQTLKCQIDESFENWSEVARHSSVTEIVCGILMSFPNVSDVWTVISASMETYMVTCEVWTVLTAYSVILLTAALDTTSADQTLGDNYRTGLANICYNLLHVIFSADSQNMTIHHKVIQEKISHLLKRQPQVMKDLFSVIGNLVQDSGRKQHIPIIAQNLTKILSDLQVKICARNHLDHLLSLVKLIEETSSDISSGAQWLTDLKYEVSLIKTFKNGTADKAD